MRPLAQIIEYTDAQLKTREISDWPNAWNGLQITNSGGVGKIGAAVDASEAVIAKAAEQGVSLLIVHHGLFWGGVQPLVGAAFRKVKTALDHDMAVYSAHLPLDLHPTLGNNALLAKALDFKRCDPFFFTKGQPVGLKVRLAISRSELKSRLETALGSAVHLCPGGPDTTGWIGIVTGGAGGEVARAAAEGVDTFITGEGPHHSFTSAEELGVNLFYGGHYATEVFGVRALAAHLSRRFRIPWLFIDHPSGL